MTEITRVKRTEQRIINKEYANPGGSISIIPTRENVEVETSAVRVPGSADRPAAEIQADIDRVQARITELETEIERQLGNLAEAVLKRKDTSAAKRATAEIRAELDATLLLAEGLKLDLQDAQRRENWTQFEQLVKDEANALRKADDAFKAWEKARSKYEQARDAALDLTHQREGLEQSVISGGQHTAADCEALKREVNALQSAADERTRNETKPGVPPSLIHQAPLLIRTKDEDGRERWERANVQ